MSAAQASAQQSQQPFPLLDTPMVEPGTGVVSRPWYRLLITLWKKTGSGIGSLAGALYVGLSAGNAPTLYRADDGSVFGTIELSGQTPDPPAVQQLGASPYVFVSQRDGFLLVSSGQVEIGRDGAFFGASLAGGSFPLKAGDSARVSWYNSAPQVTFFGDGS